VLLEIKRLGKGKVVLSYLTEHHAMKVHWGVVM